MVSRLCGLKVTASFDGSVLSWNSIVTASSSFEVEAFVLWERSSLWRWSVVICVSPLPIGSTCVTISRISSSVMSAISSCIWCWV